MEMEGPEMTTWVGRVKKEADHLALIEKGFQAVHLNQLCPAYIGLALGTVSYVWESIPLRVPRVATKYI